MKRITLYANVFILVFLLYSCSEKNNHADLKFLSDGIILPDTTIYWWGDIMENDSAVFSNYDNIPIIKNMSDEKIDTLYIGVDIYGVSDKSEISKYYIIDSISREETGSLTVKAHYGKFTAYPGEEIPFPIISISSKTENVPFHIQYNILWISQKERFVRNNNLIGFVYNMNIKDSKLRVKDPEESFIRSFLSLISNHKKPNPSTLICRFSRFQPIVTLSNPELLLKDLKNGLNKKTTLIELDSINRQHTK